MGRFSRRSELGHRKRGKTERLGQTNRCLFGRNTTYRNAKSSVFLQDREVRNDRRLHRRRIPGIAVALDQWNAPTIKSYTP